jgi:hypothetical protein
MQRVADRRLSICPRPTTVSKRVLYDVNSGPPQLGLLVAQWIVGIYLQEGSQNAR